MLVNAGATRIIKLPMIAVTNSTSISVKAAPALLEDSDGSPITDNPVRAREPSKADFRSVVEAAPKAFGAVIWAEIDLIFTRGSIRPCVYVGDDLTNPENSFTHSQKMRGVRSWRP